jgi:membrane-associated HD superfamily phosphohydrolase
MGLIPIDKFNLNQFYEKTPLPLKYVIVISTIVLSSYFLFSRKVSKNQVEEITKIEQTIKSTNSLIDKFETFQEKQYEYNEDVLEYLGDVYILVEELNENTNKKFNILLKAGGSNTNNILDQITLLNESFEKLQKAYTPEELKEDKTLPPSRIYAIPVDDKGNQVDSIRELK